MRLRLGRYLIRPDTHGWALSTIIVRGEKSKRAGEEAETDTIYPGRFDQALKRLLDRMVREDDGEHEDIARAVETVAHLYARIGREAENARR